MNLGPLNRKARLWANNPTVGEGGAPSDVLTHLKWLPATVGEVDRPQALQAMREGNEVVATITTRYYRVASVGQFFDFEGARFRIQRIRVLGRNEGMVLYGEG